MKKIILFGFLLLMGFSFAPVDGYSWMGYVESRYACAYLYDSGGYPQFDGGIGLMEIVGEYDSDCDYWTNCEDMGYDLSGMGQNLWGIYGMHYNGCSNYFPNDFRTNMLSFGSYSSDFKAKFLAGLRAYLADADQEDREDIMADLQDAMANYRYCIYDIGACYNPNQ